jgi:hypothetical protein
MMKTKSMDLREVSGFELSTHSLWGDKNAGIETIL